jgi:hypothetical protein
LGIAHVGQNLESQLAGFFDVAPVMPLIVGAEGTGSPSRRIYYFWFFGYVLKLPYE